MRTCPDVEAGADAALIAHPIRLRCRRLAALAVAAVGLVGSATSGLVATARADPGSLAAQRAEVYSLQAQLQELDARAGRIVEAYNGARYHLGVVEGQIRLNGVLLRKARADHLLAQRRLADRLVAIYREGQQTLAQLLLSAGSLSEAMDDYTQLRRLEGADRDVVTALQASRQRMARARQALLAARRVVRAEVASAARQRAAIAAVLAERRALLQRSQGQLAMLEQVERQRAAEMYRIAQARVARMQAEQRGAQGGPGGLLAAPTGAPGGLAPSGLPVAGASLSLGAGAASPASGPGLGRPDVVGYAMQLVGTPYQWGGASPAGFDCSGFVNYVYAHFGKSLPHYTGAQWSSGAQVGRGQLEPGDLVFFDGLGHDGIYIGGGQFIHSPHTGDSVKVSSLDEGWYGNRYVGAVRPA